MEQVRSKTEQGLSVIETDLSVIEMGLATYAHLPGVDLLAGVWH